MLALLRKVPFVAKVSWDTRIESAVARLHAQPVDVIVLDLLLPDSLWGQGLRRVKAAAGRTPIIVWTAIDDQFQALASLEAGAAAYLTKDRVDLEIVTNALREALGTANSTTLRAT